MIYWPKNINDLSLGMEVYVGDVPDFDEEDMELLPESVIKLGLGLGYMPEHFQDVVDLAYRQKPAATIEEVIRCLNHYDKFDNFLDLQ
jgi:hypothetical protein